jgi:hypothetical protein
VNRIGADARRVVGVLIPTGQAIDALPDQLNGRVPSLAGLTPVRYATSQSFDRTSCLAPIRCRKQYRAAIARAQRLIELHHRRALKKPAKQTTLFRGRIVQAEASLSALAACGESQVLKGSALAVP